VKLPGQVRTVLRVPVPFEVRGEIGLGDAIKTLTTKFGWKPCQACDRRAEMLNQRVVFTGRNVQYGR